MLRIGGTMMRQDVLILLFGASIVPETNYKPLRAAVRAFKREADDRTARLKHYPSGIQIQKFH